MLFRRVIWRVFFTAFLNLSMIMFRIQLAFIQWVDVNKLLINCKHFVFFQKWKKIPIIRIYNLFKTLELRIRFVCFLQQRQLPSASLILSYASRSIFCVPYNYHDRKWWHQFALFYFISIIQLINFNWLLFNYLAIL